MKNLIIISSISLFLLTLLFNGCSKEKNMLSEHKGNYSIEKICDSCVRGTGNNTESNYSGRGDYLIYSNCKLGEVGNTIYYSTNGGEIWSNINCDVKCILVHKNIFYYYSSDNKMHKSENEGNSWVVKDNLLFPSYYGKLNSSMFSDCITIYFALAIDSVWTFASTDDGETWVESKKPKKIKKEYKDFSKEIINIENSLIKYADNSFEISLDSGIIWKKYKGEINYPGVVFSFGKNVNSIYILGKNSVYVFLQQLGDIYKINLK